MDSKKHIYKRLIYNEEIKVYKHFLIDELSEKPTNCCGPQIPKYIVIHEVSLGTGCSPKIYDMEYYRQQILARAKRGSTIGYHYLVGDKKIYQFIDDYTATDHTGTEFGNKNSIGIERLICKGINEDYAIHNQAQLVATLMLKHNIPLENVVTHKQMQVMYGTPERQKNLKQCPGRMLAGFRGGFQNFKKEIKRCLIYNCFFKELLDEKDIEQISGIKKNA